MHEQLVLIEFYNNCPGVTKFTSESPITIEKVVQFLEETEGFNEDRDSITFVDMDTQSI